MNGWTCIMGRQCWKKTGWFQYQMTDQEEQTLLWKSEEYRYTEETNYINKEANKRLPEKLKYGTSIDVIVRDSNFNIYYIPGIVGDIKEHTLSIEDGVAVNGIYQTGVSWVTGKGDAVADADGAVIEFIRAPHDEDDLIRTPEFDILGIIVY